VTLRDAGDYITSLPKAEQCSMSDRQRSKPCSWSSSSTGHHDGAHWHTESIEPERRNATAPRLGSARRGCAQAALTHGADEHDPTSVIRGRIVGSKIRDGRRYRA